MNFKLTTILICLVGLDSASELFDELLDKRGGYTCYSDNECSLNEYCFKGKVRGMCVNKGKDGDLCLFDSRCLSNHCHSLRCKGLQVGKNVERNLACVSHEDCRFEQFCNEKKCTDRVKSGSSCKSDSQCLTNHCTFTNVCTDTVANIWKTDWRNGGNTRFSGK